MHAAHYKHLGNLKLLIPDLIMGQYHQNLWGWGPGNEVFKYSSGDLYEQSGLQTAYLGYPNLPLGFFAAQLNKYHCVPISKIITTQLLKIRTSLPSHTSRASPGSPCSTSRPPPCSVPKAPSIWPNVAVLESTPEQGWWSLCACFYTSSCPPLQVVSNRCSCIMPNEISNSIAMLYILTQAA